MPRFGVLTHNPSAGNPYTDFAKIYKDFDGVKDVFSHHLNVAAYWDEDRKSKRLLKREAMRELEWYSGAWHSPTGDPVFSDSTFPGDMDEFGVCFLPETSAEYDFPGAPGKTFDMQCKGMSAAQLESVMNLHPQRGEDNPILNSLMAYQWALVSILKEAEGRGGGSTDKQVSDAVTELNEVFFNELKRHYLGNLKFENREEYEEFSRLFEVGGACEGADLEAVERAHKVLTGHDKNPAVNHRRVKHNTQRFAEIFGRKFSGEVFTGSGSTEGDTVFNGVACGAGELRSRPELVSGRELRCTLEEYSGSGGNQVQEKDYERTKDLFDKFSHSRGIIPIPEVISALRRIQYTTLDAFGDSMVNPSLPKQPWLIDRSDRKRVVSSELRKELSDNIVKDGNNLLEMHHSMQSVMQQLVSAQNIAHPPVKGIFPQMESGWRRVTKGMPDVSSWPSAARNRASTFFFGRKAVKDAPLLSHDSDLVEGHQHLADCLDKAIRNGFEFKEIKKRDGTGESRFYALNKAQVKLVDQIEKFETEDVVFNVGTGGGKSHIFGVLADAGYPLLTFAWPVDLHQKVTLSERLKEIGEAGNKEVLIVLDDTSKVADSFADKIQDHTSELIREIYALGLKPKFIHSSATAKLPSVVNAKYIVDQDDKDKNVSALENLATWDTDKEKITRSDIVGKAVGEKLQDCLHRSAPKALVPESGNHSVLYFPGLNEDLIRKAIKKDKLKNIEGRFNGRNFVYFDDKQKDDQKVKDFNARREDLETGIFGSKLPSLEMSTPSAHRTKDPINVMLNNLLGKVKNYVHVADDKQLHDNPEIKVRQELVNKLFELYKGWRQIDSATASEADKKRKLLLKHQFYDTIYENLPGKAFSVRVGNDGKIVESSDYREIQKFCEDQNNQVTYLVGSENYMGRNFPDNHRMNEFHVGILGEKVSCDMSAIAQLLGRNRVGDLLGSDQMSLNFMAAGTLDMDRIRGTLAELDVAAEYRYHMKERVKPFWYDLCAMDESAKLYAHKEPKVKTDKKDDKSDPGNRYDNYLTFKEGIVKLCEDPDQFKKLQAYHEQETKTPQGKKAKKKMAREFLELVKNQLGKGINLVGGGDSYILHQGETDAKGESLQREIKGNAVDNFAKQMIDSAIIYSSWHGVDIIKGKAFKYKEAAIGVDNDIVAMRGKLMSELELEQSDPQYVAMQGLKTYREAARKDHAHQIATKEYVRVFQTLHKLEDLVKLHAGGDIKSITGFIDDCKKNLDGKVHPGVDEVIKMKEESEKQAPKLENGFAAEVLRSFTQHFESLEQVLKPKEERAMKDLHEAVVKKGLSVAIKDRSLTINKQLHGKAEQEGLKKTLEASHIVKNAKVESGRVVVELKGRALLNDDTEKMSKLIVHCVNEPIKVSHGDSSNPVSKWQKVVGGLQEREAESWRSRVSSGGQEAGSDAQRILAALEANEVGDDILELVDKLEGRVNGCPVLIAAIDKNCDIHIIEALLKRDSIVAGDTYMRGTNALHWAVGRGNFEAAKAIIGEDSTLVGIADSEGFLPRDYAVDKGKPMNDLLDKYGAKDRRGEEGEPNKPAVRKTSVTLGKFQLRHAASAVAAVAGAVIAGLLISGIFELAFAVTASLATVAIGLSIVGVAGALPFERKVEGRTSDSKVQSPAREEPTVPTIPPVELHAAAKVSREKDRRRVSPEQAGHVLH